MRRWVRGHKSSRIGILRRNPHPTLMSISASIGDLEKRRLSCAAGSLRGRLRARQVQSRLVARGLVIQSLRRLKPHKSTMLGNPKPVPYLPSCG